MPTSVVLAIASAGCFLALADAAITTSREPFRRMTSTMAIVVLPLVAVAPAAGLALLAPVLLSRRLANAPVPANVDELVERSRRRP